MKRNAKYWERRAADRMVDYMAEAEKTASDLGQAYYAASESMKDDMHRIFGSFQRAFAISEAEAKRIFASVGNESAMKSLRMAAEKIADPEQRKLALDALTSAPAYTWRIARLDNMLENVSQACNRLYKTDLKKTADFLGEITGKAYNRSVYDLQVGTETVGAAFDLLPESRVTQILKTNWSGKHYSARIYADVKDMEGKLKQTLLESMFTGESEHKIAEKVSERWQIGYNDARRLIRTETNYVSNQAELESYRSAGVKEYRFTAVLDSRTSEICAELDGKEFPVDRAKVGVNLPPMHPYCRSTTIAVIEDDIWEMSDEEIGKLMDEIDEDLGLNEDIPFEEWFEGLKETGDGKVRYVGVDKSEGNGIIDKEISIFDEYHQNLPSIKNTLHNVETERRTLNYEVGTVIDRQGNVLNITGGEAHSVSPPEDLLKNAVFTHNHPSGGCFSDQDLYSAIASELLELRASTPQGTFYSLLRTEKSRDGKIFADEYKKVISIVNATKAVQEDLKNGIISKETIKEKGFKIYIEYMSKLGDAYLSENAEKYGFIYTKGEI